MPWSDVALGHGCITLAGFWAGTGKRYFDQMIVLFIFLVFLAALSLWFVLPFFIRRWQVRRLAALCAKRRAIVLSYDDGPGRILTLRLADLLHRRRSKATFFVIGGMAEEHPELLMRLGEDGHEIGNHTQSHRNAWKVAPWTAVCDIRSGQKTLMNLGIRSDLFRPPFGKATLATLVFGFAAKQRFAYWTVDTRDSWAKPRSVEDVVAMIRRQGGGVVLMHDCDAPPRSLMPHMHTEHILALTEAIIDLASGDGFSIVNFSDLHHPSEGGAAQGRVNG